MDFTGGGVGFGDTSVDCDVSLGLTANGGAAVEATSLVCPPAVTALEAVSGEDGFRLDACFSCVDEGAEIGFGGGMDCAGGRSIAFAFCSWDTELWFIDPIDGGLVLDVFIIFC